MSVDSIVQPGLYREKSVPRVTFVQENYRADSSAARDASVKEGTEILRQAAIRSPLGRLRGLQDGWDGARSIAPNSWALANAERVLEQAHGHGLQEDRVVALPDGGVVLYFFGKDLTMAGARRFVARLAFDNECAATLLLEDVAERRHRLTDEDPEGEIDDLLIRIHDHVSG